jgi:MFS family permease
MDSFDELQNVWQGAVAPPAISAKEIVSLVRRQQRRMIAGVLVTIGALLAPIAMGVWIWIGYDPVYPTTRISLVIIMIAVVGAIVVKSQALPLLLGSVKEDASNKAMIEALERLQRKQRTFNTVGISVYYVLLSIGMALYLAEFVRGNILFGIAAYGLTFGWIAFTWFYLRKRGIKSQNAKLDQMIAHLKTLQNDWTE